MADMTAKVTVPSVSANITLPNIKAEVYRAALPTNETGQTVDIGDGLKLKNGVLSVDAADKVEEDNTKPVTSAAVFVEIGNIEVLLAAL